MENNYVYKIDYEKANKIKEYLSEILCLPMAKICVYEESFYPSESLKRIIIRFNNYFYSIRKTALEETPIDFLVQEIISCYVRDRIARINERAEKLWKTLNKHYKN